jgi:hypothetical protein
MALARPLTGTLIAVVWPLGIGAGPIGVQAANEALER